MHTVRCCPPGRLRCQSDGLIQKWCFNLWGVHTVYSPVMWIYINSIWLEWKAFNIYVFLYTELFLYKMFLWLQEVMVILLTAQGSSSFSCMLTGKLTKLCFFHTFFLQTWRQWTSHPRVVKMKTALLSNTRLFKLKFHLSKIRLTEQWQCSKDVNSGD